MLEGREKVGGRWNARAQQLVRDLVRVRAQHSPPVVRIAAASAWTRRWCRIEVVANGLSLWHGAQQAIYGTILSPVLCRRVMPSPGQMCTPVAVAAYSGRRSPLCAAAARDAMVPACSSPRRHTHGAGNEPLDPLDGKEFAFLELLGPTLDQHN